YHAAHVQRAQIDTGALILTGVALLRDNARQIAEIFAEEAGRFVAVSAGDNLEATMAAKGSGAIALSEPTNGGVLDLDIGGGTIFWNDRVKSLRPCSTPTRALAPRSSGPRSSRSRSVAAPSICHRSMSSRSGTCR